MRVYTHVDAVLGPKRAFTPEGFLFCQDVPLARTGTQIYMPQELQGIPAGDDGLIHVERHAEDVFADNAIRSFVGKPFTDDHPPDNLNSSTYKDHNRGVVLNPRKGEGELADIMVGDVLVCDKDAIQAILDGKREVSCGYSADYEIIAPGRARQRDIIGNHVALVARGRCGGRCAVGDEDLMTDTVAKTKVRIVSWKDKARAASLVGDQTALDAALAEAETAAHSGSPHIHVNIGGRTRDSDDEPDDKRDDETMEEYKERKKKESDKKDTGDSMAKLIAKTIKDSLAGIEARLAKIEKGTKDGDDDDDEDEDDDDDTKAKKKARREAKSKTDDKKSTGDADRFYSADQLPGIIQDLAARAEILVPGIKLPALDAKADPKKATLTICDHRRKVLTTSLYLPRSADAVTALMTNQPALDRMTCDQVATVFTAASENIKARNNSSSTSGTGNGGAGGNVRKVGDREFSGPVSAAEINARNSLLARNRAAPTIV